MSNNGLLNVAAYARVSTDSDDQANSFESQVRYFNSEISRHEGWNLIKVYADEGITGTSTKKREQFNQMIEDALDGRIDVILTKEVSRFARNTLDSIQYTRMLKESGVAVVFMLDGIDTRQPDAELRLTIMSALAQEESRKTSERVKWGQKRQMESGVVFGRDMLGYNVRNGKLELEPYGAEIVRQVFHKYTIEGKGSYVIARELKEAGIRPMNPDGNTHYENDWSTTIILRLLRNEKYVGDLCQKKTWTRNFLDHKKRYNRGDEEKVYIRDHHPEIAIISRELWDATQAELEKRSLTKEQKSKHSNRYWCSGKIWCGSCGERFIPKTRHTKGGSVHKSWLCYNHTKAAAFKTAECNNSNFINEKTLVFIMQTIMKFLVANKAVLKRELLDEIAALGEEKSADNSDSAKQSIAQLETRKSRLIELLLDGTISKEDFAIKKNEIDTKIDFINDRLAQVEAAIVHKEKDVSRLEKLTSEIEKLLDFNFTESSRMLATITNKVTVYFNKRVEVSIVGIPCLFELSYTTSGRCEAYRTDITDFKVKPLEKDTGN